MTTRAFQKIYTKIDNITKATVTLRAQGVGNDELATVGGKLAQDLARLALDDLTAFERFAVGVEEASRKVVRHAQLGRFAVEDHFRVGSQPLGTCENLQRHVLAHDFHHLRQLEIGGPTVNPFRRIQPSELIATGIAGIDLNNTIVTGQKIPFFADPDQPYNAVMANVALRAKADKIILGGMGLTNDDFLY